MSRWVVRSPDMCADLASHQCDWLIGRTVPAIDVAAMCSLCHVQPFVASPDSDTKTAVYPVPQRWGAQASEIADSQGGALLFLLAGSAHAGQLGKGSHLTRETQLADLQDLGFICTRSLSTDALNGTQRQRKPARTETTAFCAAAICRPHKQELKCNICFDLVVSPVTLPCGRALSFKDACRVASVSRCFKSVSEKLREIGRPGSRSGSRSSVVVKERFWRCSLAWQRASRYEATLQ